MKITYISIALVLAMLLLSGCVQPTPPAPTPIPTPTPAPTTTPVVGGDVDEHGCRASAGYIWCEPLDKCIRPWEEACEVSMPGSDRDEHGCIPSAGYEWCAPLQKCIRPWEEDCGIEVWVANAASEYCEEQGGTVQVEESDSGIKYANCLLSDGTICDAWNYYRGECPVPPATLTKAESYCGGENVTSVAICSDYIKVVNTDPSIGTTYYKTSVLDPILSTFNCPVMAFSEMNDRCKKLTTAPNCIPKQVC